MYDICLISKLIELGEILCMEKEDAIAVAGVMSESIGIEILNFFKKYDELGIENDNNEIANILKEKRKMLYDTLYLKASRYTFHLEVQERGLFDVVKRLNPETLFLVTEDKAKTIEDLEWLISKEQMWIPALEARTKDAYDLFCARMDIVTQKAKSLRVTLNVNVCKDVWKVLDRNASYFYKINEKKRFTGMHIIINNVSLIEQAINGLKYAVICEKSDMDDFTKRQFFQW